jgi:GAF domain-containing protein
VALGQLATDEALKEVQLKGAPPCFVDAHRSTLRDPGGRPTGTLVVLHDVSERVMYQRQREVLLLAVRRLATAVEARDLLAKLTAEATALVDGSFACVARWDTHQEQLVFLSTAESRSVGKATVSRGEGAFGQAAERRETVVVHAYDEQVSSAREAPLAGARAVVAAPLLHKNQLLGVVGVASIESPDAFNTMDAQSLEVLAGVGASALAGLERARLDGVHLAAKTLEHELNNRLALTVGYSELVENNPATPESVRRYASAAAQGARDASKLIDRLVTLPEVRETDWGAVVGTTIDLHNTDRS